VKTADFDFDLPETFIAAYPRGERDQSRLMRMERQSGQVSHHVFADIEPLLPRGALVVLNDSRVIPARLRGVRKTGGQVELLLIRRIPEPLPSATPSNAEAWEAIGRHLGRLVAGDELDFPEQLRVQFLSRQDGGLVRLLLLPPPGRSVAELLERVGELPLPPYILAARRLNHPHAGPAAELDDRRRSEQALDKERYQTVYASPAGSVAAPTAGLHFTSRLLEQLTAAGHQIATITLHVGLGTFRPVKTETLEEHHMDAEWYTISEEAAAQVERARGAGRPIVAVGTTVVRALESAARSGGGNAVLAGTAASRLFLAPGAEFEVVTDLVTNFHLPRSTLLMLVSAFAGRENVLHAYATAMRSGYRFYSYGDAMLIRGSQ
jgi:S-adenosylmethionine:tRNA ribosyltransferase-isomerase